MPARCHFGGMHKVTGADHRVCSSKWKPLLQLQHGTYQNECALDNSIKKKTDCGACQPLGACFVAQRSSGALLTILPWLSLLEGYSPANYCLDKLCSEVIPISRLPCSCAFLETKLKRLHNIGLYSPGLKPQLLPTLIPPLRLRLGRILPLPVPIGRST